MTAFHDRSTGDHVELSDTAFDPGEGNYTGTAYQFSKQNPSTGDWKRNSRGVANMMGQNFAKDAAMQMPTGSTTDFKMPEKSTHPAMQETTQLWGFKPNEHDKQMGAWN
jgi:hypothetical protein